MNEKELEKNADIFLSKMSRYYNENQKINIKDDVLNFLKDIEYKYHDHPEVDAFVSYLIEKDIVLYDSTIGRTKYYKLTEKGWDIIKGKEKFLSERFRN